MSHYIVLGVIFDGGSRKFTELDFVPLCGESDFIILGELSLKGELKNSRRKRTQGCLMRYQPGGIFKC